MSTQLPHSHVVGFHFHVPPVAVLTMVSWAPHAPSTTHHGAATMCGVCARSAAWTSSLSPTIMPGRTYYYTYFTDGKSKSRE